MTDQERKLKDRERYVWDIVVVINILRVRLYNEPDYLYSNIYRTAADDCIEALCTFQHLMVDKLGVDPERKIEL